MAMAHAIRPPRAILLRCAFPGATQNPRRPLRAGASAREARSPLCTPRFAVTCWQHLLGGELTQRALRTRPEVTDNLGRGQTS